MRTIDTLNDAIREDLSKFVARIEERTGKLEGVSNRFSQTRLAVTIIGVVATYLAFEYSTRLTGWGVLILFVIVFYVLVKLHSRVVYSIRKHRYYSGIKKRHIARMNRDWDGLEETALIDGDADHNFSSDLNLLGPRSLHHLLDTSFTQEGSDLLASWLTAPTPELTSILDRQSMVRELTSLTAFRDRLNLLSGLVTKDATDKWDGALLLKWLASHVDRRRMLPVLVLLSTLAFVTIGLVVARFVTDIGNWWALSMTVYAGIYLTNFRLYAHLFDEAEHLYFELSRFRPVLSFMERFKFRSGSNLAKLISPLQNSERLPTSYLRKALWLSIAASAQKNEVIRLLFNVLFPWDLFFAYRLAIYKESLRERLPIWLGTVNSFEALCSLATFRAINAHVTFPNVIQHDPDDPLRSSFVGKNIGHPLLPVKSRVTNDFTIEGVGEIALVTGSNMSGKSTFLRTVGVNISLAQAGGPVDAESLTLTPSRLFTCINVSDSVNDGISYFYAEVKRLKRLLDQINSDGPPVLFLVDEIFRGTNNRERFTGSRALLLSLAQLSAVGLVSTHDLDLVDLENAEGASIANYHFREHIEGGKMVFDYELRPGPCPTTNALAIMELEGLPITAP